MTEKIVAMAKALGAGEGQAELLSVLCQAAQRELEGRLKPELTPEDCESAFVPAAAWMARQMDVVPIWGIQHEWELDQFLACVKETPVWTQEYQDIIDQDRKELTGDFCRSCGYCMPCPVGIQISQCARMGLMLRRMPTADYLTEYWQEEMKKVENCLHCNQCSKKCPYGLDIPRLIRENYREYQTYFNR